MLHGTDSVRKIKSYEREIKIYEQENKDAIVRNAKQQLSHKWQAETIHVSVLQRS